MMRSVEDSPPKTSIAERDNLFKIVSAFLLIGLLIVSGLYINLSRKLEEQSVMIETQNAELVRLSERYDELAYLEPIINISVQRPFTHFLRGYMVVSGYNLEYWHDWAYDPPRLSHIEFYVVFYAPEDGLNLRMTLTTLAEKGVIIPLTLQRGDAFLNESGVFVEERGLTTIWQSSVIWTVNATGNDVYEAMLPSEGWYTLCMTGPIRRTSTGSTTLTAVIRGRLVNGTWQRVESVKAWLDFRLLSDERPVLFIVDKKR